MTDTRLPEAWLTDPVLDALSSDAIRVFFFGLMWSNTNGTDGVIPERVLRLLHPDGKRQDCVEELVAARLWRVQQSAGTYRVVGFLDHQTSAAEMEAKRKLNRERQRQFRQRQMKEKRRQLVESAAPDVTRDVTDNVGRYVGQEQEQEQEQANNGNEPPTDRGRARDADDPWAAA